MSDAVQHARPNDVKDDIELKPFLGDLEAGHDVKGFNSGKGAGAIRNTKGRWLCYVERLDERFNFEHSTVLLHPYISFVIRLMLVSTFLDDSFRTAFRFSDQVKEVAELGLVKNAAFATIALLVGLGAQWVGSLCLLRLSWTDGATKALICWAILQPTLYGQLSNFELVSETLSLIGGLLMLRAHVVDRVATRTQLAGRLLLPAMYVYYAGKFLISAITLDETTGVGMYIASLSMFVVNTLVFMGIVVGSVLVAVGLRSRIIALLLAFTNLGFVFYRHPYFRYAWREDGQWKYDADMPMPDVSLPKDISPVDLDLEQIYGLHRYYFFLGLSNSGALLLLAQYGPGEIALQKDETILPTRAQD